MDNGFADDIDRLHAGTSANVKKVATTVRLLVHDVLVGSIFGDSGTIIRDIQRRSNTALIIDKEMLPDSTEHVLTVKGTSDDIQAACVEVCEHLMHAVSEMRKFRSPKKKD